MLEKLLKFIEKNPYSQFKDFCAFFSEKKNFILITINNAINDGYIIEENGEYILPSALGLLRARIVAVKDNYAFANIDGNEEDVMIDAEDLANALLGDIVYLRVKYKYKVIKIIKRRFTNIIGEVMVSHNVFYLLVDSIATKNTVFVIKEGPAKTGDLVVCSIISFDKEIINLKIEKVLGAKNAPHMDITRIIIANDAPIEFNEAVHQEVVEIPLAIEEKECQSRKDFRHNFIVTIDGEDAKDLDDAVSVKKTESGYEVGIHIADVSYYVNQGSAIDKEAYARGTSIYVTDRVVPMLPFALSNGICSLNPHEDRLTISCLVKLDVNGEIIDSEICESVINSQHRLTYTYVNEVIAKNKQEGELTQNILLLNEVAVLVGNIRHKKGTLDLDSTEVKFIVDENGYPLEIMKRTQGAGETLIENLMILANEVVATTINKKKLPFLYRIHENPPSKRLQNFIDFATNLGYFPRFSSLNAKPIDIQELLLKTKGHDDFEIISAILLRSLAKARYAPNNLGHFGLASVCYTHFTSPIRRYPDLIVHRLLRKYLFQNDFEDTKELSEDLGIIAESTSAKERRAIAIEREVINMKGAEYMQKHIGEEMDGLISGMNNGGMFVALENGLSGAIKFESLNDYFFIDEKGQNAFGRRKKQKYSLGDKVRVIITEANKTKGQITLTVLGQKSSRKSYNEKPKNDFQENKKKYTKGRRK